MSAKVTDVNDAMKADRAAAERALFESDGVPMPSPEQEAQAARSKNFMESAPTLASLYGPEQLLADSAREVVSIAMLPGWPTTDRNQAHSWGHGLGPELNKAIGGGIRPGAIIGVAAAAAKAGKTALIHQVADGLALRCAEEMKKPNGGPLTPVVILSEMDPQALTWRTLARWTGFAASHFRMGKSAAQWPEYSEEMWPTAERALASGPLADARAVTHHFKARASGVELVAQLGEIAKTLRETLGQKGREVWPVFMLDPVQRWAGQAKSAIESMDQFANALNAEAKETGFVVLLTSDATKNTATGNRAGGDNVTAEEEGAAAFRGSYTLQHILDAALYLRPQKSDLERADGVRELEVVSVFSRWGGGGPPVPFEFLGRTMRLRSTLSATNRKSGLRVGFEEVAP